MYVNAAANDGTAAAEMKKYFKTADPDDIKHGELSNRVNYLKKEKGGHDVMCKELEDLMEENLLKERFRSITQIMQKLHYTIEEAMDLLNIPAEERDTYHAMI